MSKLLLIIIFIIAGVGLYLGFGSKYFQKQSVSQKYTGPVEKVNFSSSLGVKNAGVYIAKFKGYFQEEGLDV